MYSYSCSSTGSRGSYYYSTIDRSMYSSSRSSTCTRLDIDSTQLR
eukprot:COSAG05_NODE_15898_length_358_cov_1.011583_1_plen_44_part_01